MSKRHWYWWIPLALVFASALGTVGLILWIAKRAEPIYSGTLELAGLSRPVEVRFGPHAVPTLVASDLEDLIFAQGYVTAAERMWQMDLLRRLGGGRLAELFGQDAVAVDRFFRTLGLPLEARRALEALEASDRALLAAYAAGVNAYRERARHRLPLEYVIAGLEPAPWQPEDSLVIGAYMAWTQSFNMRAELTFLRLARRIGPERARLLFPTDAGLAPPEVPPELVAYLATTATGPSSRPGFDSAAIVPFIDLPAWPGLPPPTAASNAWLATGARTATGEALLANDPHLAFSMPGPWYELELIGPRLHVAGVSLPGVPLVLIGHNADLAWGITTAVADTQDLFIERPTPDGRAVEREGRTPEPIQVRYEAIQVRGTDPIEIAIRSTSRGVVLNDILGVRTATPMDLADPDLDALIVLRQNHDHPDQSFQAVRRLCQARTLDEARAAGLDFRHVVLNLMLAHHDGGIAWQMTGVLPQRGRGAGAFPNPGWNDDYAWRGEVPQALNPSLTDPPSGIIITANQRTIPPDHPLRVSNAWMSPHRAQRIAARIENAGPLTPESMAAIQADRISLQGRMMQSSLRRLEAEIRALDPGAWLLAERHVLDWDGDMDASSRPAAFAALLEPALFQALYGDELGEDLPYLLSLAIVAYNPLQETLRTGESAFWDDVTTPEPETPAAIWARALRKAKTALDGYGAEVRLADLRRVRFTHAFDRLPLLGDLFSVGPIGVGGSSDTVDVIKTEPQAPGKGLFGASMRVVATPADWRRTRGTLTLGQSGHRFSPYRSDQLEDWLVVRSHPWPWNGPDDAHTLGRLQLDPLDASERVER
ncbi:penicillin acylase family protein [Thermochromatium tepidum]|uniref:Penicillin acylase family protein n=1 Tax=Thermochromatium tepidum ATCC 43061 TaxID=316276 RepID=A0A6I6DYW0_THETI|nr:penicillin acylase family protein [Thermochromatium tepidum]QGU32831.1 penicillin acylase family protein [Thermochromatium tepidum ATCC 43061]